MISAQDIYNKLTDLALVEIKRLEKQFPYSDFGHTVNYQKSSYTIWMDGEPYKTSRVPMA